MKYLIEYEKFQQKEGKQQEEQLRQGTKQNSKKRKHTNKEAERESTHHKAPIGWAEREHSHLHRREIIRFEENLLNGIYASSASSSLLLNTKVTWLIVQAGCAKIAFLHLYDVQNMFWTVCY